MKKISLLLVLCLAANLLPAQLPQAAFDVQHYRFELTLSDETDEIEGHTTIELKARASLAEIALDLVGPLDNGKGMKVLEVKEIEHENLLRFSQQDERLLIWGFAPLKPAEFLRLRIHYRGVPADGLIISKNKYGQRTFFGDNWPNRAHHWLPTVDHPSDKASCEFVVTAPAHYELIANGELQEESTLPSGMKLTHWKTYHPLATKVMVIGAGEFAIQHLPAYRGIPVQSWVFPQDREAGFYDFAPARDILTLFESRIGPYPYSKLANVQSKTRYGGMENAGNIFYAENAIKGGQTINRLLAHEIAHQWFGNSASELEWKHIWLSEGFATFFAHIYVEHSQGTAAMLASLQKDKVSIFAFHQRRPQAVMVDEKVKDLNQYLNAYSYQKGGWVLHMLRRKLGELHFWQGIRQYYARYCHSNATTEDFQEVMEAVSGQDLQPFFQQWCYRPDYPRIEGSWHYDARQQALVVELNQTQGGEPFELDVEVGILTKAGEQPLLKTFRMSQSSQAFSIPLQAAPAAVQLDPRSSLLMEAAFHAR